MVDTINYEEWIRKARQDLRGARILFEATGADDLVAFHCQQAVEKYLKAYLIQSTGILHSGHFLMGLLKKCYQIDNRFRRFINHVTYLNTYYIETRYPSVDALEVDREDAKQCLDYAAEILDFDFIKEENID